MFYRQFKLEDIAAELSTSYAIPDTTEVVVFDAVDILIQ